MPSCGASGEKRFMEKYKKEKQENVEKENIEIRIAPPQKKITDNTTLTKTTDGIDVDAYRTKVINIEQ